MDTKIRGHVETRKAAIDTDTVIEAGDLVAIDTGLIIKATSTSGKVSRAQEAHAAGGPLLIEISIGKIEITMDSSDVFAVTQREIAYDIAIDGNGKATVNQSGNTYKNIRIAIDNKVGKVGKTTDIKCVIDKPIDDRLITVD